METRIEGLTDLFKQSIGIREPWYIRSIEVKEMAVHVYVDIREGKFLPCPECGKMCRRAGYEKEERVWRHGDCLFYPCYVHCRRPRVRCEEHKTKVVEAPWARKHSRFTLMFEGYSMLMLMDKKRAADTLRNYTDEILNYFHSRLTNAICEGINSMIQAAKRKARGYHTFKGFSSMIYLVAGKFSLAFPNPLR